MNSDNEDIVFCIQIAKLFNAKNNTLTHTYLYTFTL